MVVDDFRIPRQVEHVGFRAPTEPVPRLNAHLSQVIRQCVRLCDG